MLIFRHPGREDSVRFPGSPQSVSLYTSQNSPTSILTGGGPRQKYEYHQMTCQRHLADISIERTEIRYRNGVLRSCAMNAWVASPTGASSTTKNHPIVVFLGARRGLENPQPLRVYGF